MSLCATYHAHLSPHYLDSQYRTILRITTRANRIIPLTVAGLEYSREYSVNIPTDNSL